MKKIFTICVAALMVPTVVLAQKNDEIRYIGKIKVIPHVLAQRGDSLYVNLDMSMEGISVESCNSLDIIPVLNNGNKAIELPKVSIKGKRKYKAYYRQLALMSKRQRAAYTEPYAVEKGYNNASTLSYKLVMPYEQWMEDAHLDAKSDLCGCRGITRQVEMERLVNNVSIENNIILKTYEIDPYLAYLNADIETIKHREVENEVYLDFEVGKATLVTDSKTNFAELRKIPALIDNILNDRAMHIRNITITGYASPDGPLALNKRLSEERAYFLQNYLQMRYLEIPRTTYSVNFGGEDWNGLVKLLNNSERDDKLSMLNIISKTPNENTRKLKLKNLNGGKSYRYCIDYLFPKLRRAVVTVGYDINNFNAEEAKEVIKTHPQNLSLSELFSVANTYKKGSPEFNDVFETAVRMYPQSQTANLNAAMSALARKDLLSAERYLNNVKITQPTPEYDNARGVLELLKGNYDSAEQLFIKAKDAGLSKVQHNLDELAKKRENIKRNNKYSKE